MFCRPQAVHACWLLVFSLALPSVAGGQQIFRSSRANQAVRGHLLDLEAGTPIFTGVLPRAVLLEPLLVVGRTNRGMNKFSEHMEEWGEGIFLTPDMIDSIAPRHYGDVFRKQEDIWLSWGWGTWSTSSLRASGTSQLGRYRGGGWADPVGGATYSNHEFGECGVVVYWTTEEW